MKEIPGSSYQKMDEATKAIQTIPVVPHKAVAEVSKIGNL